MIKHATAGAFTFHHVGDQWRLGLIRHARLGRWMIPGGHVELHETPAAAALREVTEETGLIGVRLVEASWMQLPPFPDTHNLVPMPWWINEVSVAPDNHLAEDHVHVDHNYLATVENPEPGITPELPFQWFRDDEVRDLHMFADTRLMATHLFDAISGPTQVSLLAEALRYHSRPSVMAR